MKSLELDLLISEDPFLLSSHLPLLRYLYLDGNSLNSGEVRPDEEEEIGNLTTSLQGLSLAGNKFSNDMLLLVLCLKELEYLDLNNNRLIGGMPLSMKKLSKLEGLYLQNNLLIGETLPWLFDFKGLEDLYVGGNCLIWNSSVSVEIASNPRPFRLSLKSCGLVGFK